MRIMKIKSLIVLLAICLSACTGSKYAGVPNQYQELISQTMQTAGSNAKELKKALKQAPTTQREGGYGFPYRLYARKGCQGSDCRLPA